VSGTALLATTALASLLAASGCGSGGSTAPTPPVTLQAGIKLQTDGHLAAAKQLYQQVLAKQPSNVYALYDLGSIAQQQGQNVEALSQYGKALTANPTFVPALYNEAVIYTGTDPVLAISLYRQIVHIDPTQAGSHLNLGLLELSHHERAQAINDVAIATKDDPTLVPRVPKKIAKAVAKARKKLPTPTPSATAPGSLPGVPATGSSTP
jgi:tetratricopeptide (TPR) repeat protein